MKSARIIGVAAAAAVGVALLARHQRALRAIDFAGKTVVIFGGSRGLGLVMARQFASEGANLVLAARDGDALERAALELTETGAQVTTLVCDVTNRQQVEQTIDDVMAEYGRIDVLINDAGIMEVGPVEHMTNDDFERAMATHFWGPLFTIQTALPYMRRGGAKRIVNISSIGGKIAVPHMLPYSASKFALTGLSEGLRAELAGDGFSVTTVCPGLMRTGSTYNASFKGQHRREFSWFHMSASTPVISIDARRAARQIIDAIRHGDAEVILTPVARFAVVLNALCPKTMARAMSLANWLLPRPAGHDGNQSHSGWQSVSPMVPSKLTALSDRATAENNELPTTT